MESLRPVSSAPGGRARRAGLHARAGWLLEQLPRAVCILDRDLRYVAATPAWRRQQEVEEERLLGRSIYELQHRFDFSKFCPGYFRMALEGAPQGGRVERFETEGGAVEWIDWHVTPLRGFDGDEVVGVVVSLELVTPLEQLEQGLVDERARRVHVAKLAALGEMAGGIGHELNNPLAICAGLADELRDLASGDPALCEVSRELERTVDRMAGIVRTLRRLARDASDDLSELCDLRSVVEDGLALSRARFASAGIALQAEVPEEPVILRCQRVPLGQALSSLLDNAFDAVANQPGGWARVSLTASDEEVTLSVTDNGPGVPESLRDDILRPFFTTKPVGEATGLGLSVAHQILRRQGGEIALEQGAQGTSFRMVLPRHQAG
ncbi:MAG: ATP-binding protein [Polyangiaceae bacterium]